MTQIEITHTVAQRDSDSQEEDLRNCIRYVSSGKCASRFLHLFGSRGSAKTRVKELTNFVVFLVIMATAKRP
jgi:hypothetical protein